MAGLTQAQKETALALWVAADAAVSVGQEFSHNGRTFKRADVAEIRNNITFWDNLVQKGARGGIAIRGATPIG